MSTTTTPTDDDTITADCGHETNDPHTTACGDTTCSDDCHTEHLCACRACAADEAAHLDLR